MLKHYMYIIYLHEARSNNEHIPGDEFKSCQAKCVFHEMCTIYWELNREPIYYILMSRRLQDI